MPTLSHDPLRCQYNGICVTTTGTGKSSAGPSLTAILHAKQLNMSNSYFVISGIAGTRPDAGTDGFRGSLGSSGSRTGSSTEISAPTSTIATCRPAIRSRSVVGHGSGCRTTRTGSFISTSSWLLFQLGSFRAFRGIVLGLHGCGGVLAKELHSPVVQRWPRDAKLLRHGLRASLPHAQPDHRGLFIHRCPLFRSPDHPRASFRMQLLEPRAEHRPRGVAKCLDRHREAVAVLRVVLNRPFLLRLRELRKAGIASVQVEVLLVLPMPAF